MLNNIGNIMCFGLLDILLVVLIKFLKKLLNSIFKAKVNSDILRVSTHLKECGFTDGYL